MNMNNEWSLISQTVTDVVDSCVRDVPDMFLCRHYVVK